VTAADSRRVRGTALAFALCAALAAAGVGLTVLAGWTAHPLAPFTIPWPVLAVLFVVAQRLPIDFEFRFQSRSVTLSQLPLALGAVAVTPGMHLLAAVVGAATVSVMQRQAPVRAAFNLAVSALEVGAIVATVHLVGSTRPDPALWVAITAGLLLGELVGQLTLPAVWRALALPMTRQQVLQPLLVGLLSTLVFAAIAIVALTALWNDARITAVILFLVGAVSLAYRGHRRLSAQQQTTRQLYDFVKDLGPLDEDDARTQDVLEQVRILLHTRCLDLALLQRDGTWRHLVAWEGGEGPVEPPTRVVALAQQVASTGTATLLRHRGSEDQMATPVVGSAGLLGILTATERLGDVRPFDMEDLRLLETVATELATAVERGRMLSDLGRAATTDALTGLPNLPETARRLAALVAEGSPLVLATVAVESFREVNDALGHQVGDDLLIEVARRLERSQAGALIGRIGGGRFAVAVPLQPDCDAAMFGLQLRAEVEGSATVGGTGTHLRLSVGLAVAPDHGTDAGVLLKRAQTAMYSARQAYGGPLLWEPAYEFRGQRRMAVVSALREAIGSGAIALAYQPKVDMGTGTVTGIEALARWSHPALGRVAPDEFIPLAEASGVMGPLTLGVLRQALAACRDWQGPGQPVGVSVNVDADTVLDPSFITDVAAAVTQAGLAPELLTLELTESVLVEDAAVAVERMAELRTLGVRISVDDFGTGYSSLTYLKGLPVDEVKIDKGFITRLAVEPADQAVVRAVVDIAHTLGLKVVAEGVEHQAQQRLLQALGVDELQGYLHARPMPASQMVSWLLARRRLRARGTRLR
jgi:diguanylate cyclase (GGDEF)-like protein